MKGRFTRLKGICFTLIAILIVGLAILTTNSSSSHSHSAQSAEPHVINQTQALEAVKLINDGKAILLSLKNGSGKNIKAYTVSMSGPNVDLKMEEDFIVSERVIAPEEVYTVALSNWRPGLDINICGVVFEDRTGDGDRQAVADILNRRRGQKLQLQRTLPLLQAASSSRLDGTLVTLRSQISSLSEDAEDGSPATFSFTSGLHNGKEDALRAVREIEENRQRNPDLSLNDQLIKARTSLEEKAKRL